MATTSPTVSKAVLEQLLDAEKLKYCHGCGICTGSCPIVEILGKDFNPRGLLEKITHNPEHALISDELWLCAWCYRCHKRCNQALKLPEIFLAIRKMAVEQGYAHVSDSAFGKIVENLPLPLVTTLVCFHPERAGLDQDKTLENVGQMHEEHLKREKARRAQEVHQERIAVIGSGPAGLTVAYELSRKGYGITVFEALQEPGGMLRECIPRYRLPRDVLNREIQNIKDLGVEIRTGVKIGQDLSLNSLWREGYKAVFLGSGAHKGQQLKIEGESLKGVYNALEFLWASNSGEKVETGNKVVVIGGGNVAVDAARTALKLGSKEVTVLYRRSREEMPAIPWEVREAEGEGMKIEFLVSPKKIIEDKGNVCAVECIRMQLGEPDETGRKKATEIAGSGFKRETDMVILAIGETPDLEYLTKEVEVNEDGTLWVDPLTMQTSCQGIFAGGDIVTGPATVIEAILAGKRAATSIGTYLRKLRG